VVTRFRMNDKAVRRPELGDPVLDRRGKIVGTVTSCAIDADGYLLGQAVLPLDMHDPGTQISIYQLGGGTRSLPAAKPGSGPADAGSGRRDCAVAFPVAQEEVEILSAGGPARMAGRPAFLGIFRHNLL
jgi:hypothetical protein